MSKFIFDNERWLKDMRKSRNKLGESMRDLGSKVGVSASTICRIENGTYEPSISEFIRICASLDMVAIEYFDEDEVQLRLF